MRSAIVGSLLLLSLSRTSVFCLVSVECVNMTVIKWISLQFITMFICSAQLTCASLHTHRRSLPDIPSLSKWRNIISTHTHKRTRKPQDTINRGMVRRREKLIAREMINSSPNPNDKLKLSPSFQRQFHLPRVASGGGAFYMHKAPTQCAQYA